MERAMEKQKKGMTRGKMAAANSRRSDKQKAKTLMQKHPKQLPGSCELRLYLVITLFPHARFAAHGHAVPRQTAQIRPPSKRTVSIGVPRPSSCTVSVNGK